MMCLPLHVDLYLLASISGFSLWFYSFAFMVSPFWVALFAHYSTMVLYRYLLILILFVLLLDW
jgi:hypothetical protein